MYLCLLSLTPPTGGPLSFGSGPSATEQVCISLPPQQSVSQAAADLQAHVSERKSSTVWGNPPTVPITYVLAKNDARERKIKEAMGVPTTLRTAPARVSSGKAVLTGWLALYVSERLQLW